MKKIALFVKMLYNMYIVNEIFDEIIDLLRGDFIMNNTKIMQKDLISKIEDIFQYFTTNVIGDLSKLNIDANEIVNVFYSVLKKDYSLKSNQLIVGNYKIPVNIEKFNSIENEDILKDIDDFSLISDRLIEDTNRRFKGEFYTPSTWVNEAHRMISDKFGDDWKDKYIVWDCACGTRNLTRDYEFKNLYCSTLNESDLEISKDCNENATAFQYDFLNDDSSLSINSSRDDLKMPYELYKSLKEDKPILFLINPPYATASNGKSKTSKSKDGTGDTYINKVMKDNKVGASSQQLYAQFLYRIILIKKEFNLSNVKIALFSPSLYLSGPSYKGFRKEFLKEFKFDDGMLFNASHFSDVKASWGINFALWSSGESTDKENFIHDIKDVCDKGTIKVIERKNIYNLDKSKSCSNWIKNPKCNLEKKSITLKSAINVGTKTSMVDANNLGFLINDSNNVYANTQGVYLISSKITRHIKTTTILPENFEDCMSLFTARKVIKSNWINQKDEYLMPNKEHLSYKEFELDSVIYALFNTSSNQASLRNILFDNESFDIPNNLFFMSKNDVEKMAIKHNNKEILDDLNKFGEERFVYKYLQDKKLSKESQEVLDKAVELIEKSFEYRNLFNQENPKYNINTWDAGWYQIKTILKEYLKEDLDEFNKIYSSLENKLKDLVYELGFLK